MLRKFDILFNKILTEQKIIKEGWGRSKWGYKNFFPVMTTDGQNTGWFMGPSDGTQFKEGKKCSLDPNYTFKPDQVVVINPNRPGDQIAISSLYRALSGDTLLQQKMVNDFELPLTIDIH